MTKSRCALALFSLMLGAGQTRSGFVNKIFKDPGGDVKYVVFVPKDYTGQREYPVILFLHGSGQTGTDGKKQTEGALAKAIRGTKGQFPFITVFPQSQKGGWRAHSAEGKRAIAILDEVEKNYRTDKKRVYLTGLSMGGSGTWSLAGAHRERWAAIAPICGVGNSKDVEKLKNIPCWSFWGDKDKSTVVESNRTMVNVLKTAGAEIRHNEYRGVGHNAWDRAYAAAELYAWFLKHSTK